MSRQAAISVVSIASSPREAVSSNGSQGISTTRIRVSRDDNGRQRPATRSHSR